MTRVPNIFHFVFGFRPQTEPFHLMHYLCLASCIAVNRPDQVMFHYHNEPWGPLWDRIKPFLTLVKVTPDATVAAHTYDDAAFNQFRYAHLSDIARLEALARHGGVYADMDSLFVSPLPAALFDQPAAMGEEKVDWTQGEAREAGGSLCNAWIMSRPGAAFIVQWQARILESFGTSWSGHATFLPYRLARENPQWVHVAPKRSFFHFDWDRQGVKDIFDREVNDLSGVHSIHLWSHLWWDAERRDISTFHQGRLTAAYVRHARTTYAAIARPFLPETLGDQSAARFARERCRAILEDTLWSAGDTFGRLARRLKRALGRHD